MNKKNKIYIKTEKILKEEDFYKNFIYAQIFGLIFLLICMLLRPQIPFGGKGVSAFGVNYITFLPYSIGYLLYAYFIQKCSQAIIKKDNYSKWIKYSLNIISICFVALIFTPYAINTQFNDIHTTVSTTLFLTELILSMYLINKNSYNFKVSLFLVIQIIGGLISMLSIANNGLHYLFEGEIIFQVAFVLIASVYIKELNL